MSSHSEFIHDAFHGLSQPVMALRAALELGLRDHSDQPAAQKTFSDCLRLVERLTQELAIVREIATLEPDAPLEPCDGKGLLSACVQEMAPVARACGVALHLNAEPAKIACNASMLQRAVFLLLDDLIARAPACGISIELARDGGEARLELRPGSAPGMRQQLCRKLIECSGGRDIRFETDRTHCRF